MTIFLERVSFEVQLCIKCTYFEDYYYYYFSPKGFSLNIKLRLLGVTAMQEELNNFTRNEV
jgi:hypothetical protein